jgi:hypothetical protein
MKKGRGRGKINPIEILAVIAGAAVAGKLGNLNLPINDKIKKAIPLIGGVFLSMQKNQSIKMVGYGMAAMGGVKMVAEFVPALGIGQGMDLGAFELIEGASDYALNGTNNTGVNQSSALFGIHANLDDSGNSDNFSM